MPYWPPGSNGDRPAFETVTFDLFGTLVHLDDTRLPCMSIDGVSVPSLLAAPFGRLHALAPAVNLGDALVAYVEAGAELKVRPVAEVDREVSPCAQFVSCLERIGIADDALARELAQSQMEAHAAGGPTCRGSPFSPLPLAGSRLRARTGFQPRRCSRRARSPVAPGVGSILRRGGFLE